MKRLIKSEIYDGFNDKYDNEYVEIFKNPTSDEIKIIWKDTTSIRGAIDKVGDKFIWPGNILHGELNNYIKNKVDMSYFTFAIDSKGWYCHLIDKLNYEECQKVMRDNINYLAQIRDLNKPLELMLIDGNFDFKSVNEFINSEKP